MGKNPKNGLLLHIFEKIFFHFLKICVLFDIFFILECRYAKNGGKTRFLNSEIWTKNFSKLGSKWRFLRKYAVKSQKIDFIVFTTVKRYFSIINFPIFQILNFWKLQIFQISDFWKFQFFRFLKISIFEIFDFSYFSIFEIFNFWDFQFFEIPIFGICKFLEVGFFESQIFIIFTLFIQKLRSSYLRRFMKNKFAKNCQFWKSKNSEILQ